MLGPSGSGKSTLLRCINHLEKIDAGRICGGRRPGRVPRRRGDRLYELREREVAAQRRAIGMVFQRFNLFPHLTALDNVDGGSDAGPGRAESRGARAGAASCWTGSGWPTGRDAYPDQLSGGQQQRVAIARALAMRPKRDAVRRADLARWTRSWSARCWT